MADIKVLIVEDDEELHTLYGLYLQGESYEVLRAFHGRQALDVLQRESPSVIVLDMIMPEMGGEDLLRELRARDLAQRIPVIIASVNEKIPREILGMKNIFAVLRKPFSMDILIGKIKDALNHRA